ncbi:MAG: hypothetical protein IPK19_13210 [Chloroflexi bacterium]|nr:hypothetical protein [Chloroflexota bacterium]
MRQNGGGSASWQNQMAAYFLSGRRWYWATAVV